MVAQPYGVEDYAPYSAFEQPTTLIYASASFLLCFLLLLLR